MTIISEQQLDPAVIKRAEYVKGLRALADILDAHPELPLPYDGNSTALDWIEVAADDGAGQFYLTFQLHGLALRVITTRAQMCERVVTGRREVEIEELDPVALAALPKIKRTEVVEDVEWQCRPVLAGEQPESAHI